MNLEQSIPAWVRAHPAAIDTAAVGLALFFTMTDVASGGYEAAQRPPNLLTYVLLVGQVAPFAFRRRYPITVMYVMVASLGVYWILNYPAGADAAASSASIL